jgi:hypothetical protein
MKKNHYQKGFTLLIAIVTTGMLLLVSFVVANIALKQLVIAYTGEESQNAFYAADSGIECATYNDIKKVGGISPFATTTIGGTVVCNDQIITTGSQNAIPTSPTQPSVIGGGGDANPTSIFYLTFTKGCAILRVTKLANGDTQIESRGYNTCNTSADRRFERGLTVTY